MLLIVCHIGINFPESFYMSKEVFDSMPYFSNSFIIINRLLAIYLRWYSSNVSITLDL